MARQDLKLIENDIDISSGDFIINLSDEQHVIDTINAYPGHWKQYPLDGVGVEFYKGGPGLDNILLRQISIQLNNDGYLTQQPKVLSKPDNTMDIFPNAIPNY